MLDSYAGVWFYTTNTAFYDVPVPKAQTEAPVGSLEGHLSRDFKRLAGLKKLRGWTSLDGNFWWGGVGALNGAGSLETKQTMATATRRAHKHFQLDPAKIKPAQKALHAKTETEAIERALDIAIAEQEKTAWFCNPQNVLSRALLKLRARLRHAGWLDAARTLHRLPPLSATTVGSPNFEHFSGRWSRSRAASPMTLSLKSGLPPIPDCSHASTKARPRRWSHCNPRRSVADADVADYLG